MGESGGLDFIGDVLLAAFQALRRPRVVNWADVPKLPDRTFTAEAPIAEDEPVAMARAMGRALDDVAEQVARAVAGSLAAAPTAGKPSLRGRPHGRTR